MPYSVTYLTVNLVAMFVVLAALAIIPYYIAVKLMRYAIRQDRRDYEYAVRRRAERRIAAAQAACIDTNNTEDF